MQTSSQPLQRGQRPHERLTALPFIIRRGGRILIRHPVNQPVLAFLGDGHVKQAKKRPWPDHVKVGSVWMLGCQGDVPFRENRPLQTQASQISRLNVQPDSKTVQSVLQSVMNVDQDEKSGKTSRKHPITRDEPFLVVQRRADGDAAERKPHADTTERQAGAFTLGEQVDAAFQAPKDPPVESLTSFIHHTDHRGRYVLPAHSSTHVTHAWEMTHVGAYPGDVEGCSGRLSKY